MTRRDVLTTDYEDCAQEGVPGRIRSPKKAKGPGCLFWVAMVWLALAIGFLALTAKAEAQTFAPANDSSAIILEVRNFDADSAQVFAGSGHDFFVLGWVRGHAKRIFTIASSTLADVPSITIAIAQGGKLLETPGPVVIPRGQWWVVAVGTPPKKTEA